MKPLIIAAALAGISMSCAAQAKDAKTTPPLVVIHGTCDPKSGVSLNYGENSSFGCDSVAVIRTERGVLIQFVDNSGDDGRSLGFAGTIEGKQGFGANPVQMVVVQRIYLAGGAKPVLAEVGGCTLNWSGLQRTGGQLTAVVCGAGGQADGKVIWALAVLESR